MLETVLDGLPAAGAVIGADGSVGFCNRHLQHLTGWVAGEVRGRCWFETFLPEAERQSRRAEYLSAMESDFPKKHVGGMLLSRNGREIPVIWIRAILRNIEGKAIGAVKLGIEISEMLVHSDEVSRLRRYERIGRSAAPLVHDLNNVLCLILCYSQIVMKDMPALGGHAVRIGDAVKRGRILSDQLFALLRGEERGDLIEIDVCGAVRDFEEFLRSMLKEKIVLRTELEPDAGTIMGDRMQLERILMNLVSNSCDALPDGGEIRIGVSDISVMEPVHCRSSEMLPGRYVLLSFSDTGHGMEKEVLDRIFEPFFTTKKSRASGIGLMGVMEIAGHLGAHLRVSSSPSAGTTFEIYFPRL